jgi:hypothetical protein
MRKAFIIVTLIILPLTAGAQLLPRPIDSAVINTPHELDKVIRMAFERLPFVQQTTTWVKGVSGVDTSRVVFPEPFRDTGYVVFAQLRNYISLSNNENLNYITTDRRRQSFLLKTILVPAGDSVLFDVVAIGKRSVF